MKESEILQYLRRQCNLTPQDMAHKIHMSPHRYRNLENGRTNIMPFDKEKILQHLSIPEVYWDLLIMDKGGKAYVKARRFIIKLIEAEYNLFVPPSPLTIGFH
jgi:transcriptional regulator with XRE-family HTH domain